VSKGVAQKPLALARVYALVPGELERGSKVVKVPSLYFDLKLKFCLIRGLPTPSYLWYL
jgi:hypothetical protein